MLKGTVKILIAVLFAVFIHAAECFAQSVETPPAGVPPTETPPTGENLGAGVPPTETPPTGDVANGNSTNGEAAGERPRLEGNIPPDVDVQPTPSVAESLPEHSPYEIRVEDSRFDPMALDEENVPGSPPRTMSRQERRALRKAEKEQAQEPVVQMPRSFRITSGRKIEESLPDASADSLLARARHDSIEGLSLDSMAMKQIDSLSTVHADILAALPPAEALFGNGATAEDIVRADSLLRSHGIEPDSLRRAVMESSGSTAASEETDSLSGQAVREISQEAVRRSAYVSMRDSVVMALEGQMDRTAKLLAADADSLQLSRRELRRKQRLLDRADTTLYRHNRFFRDSLRFNRFVVLSAVVPGFGQFYNGDYWKIPAIYGAVGAATYFAVQQNRKFQNYKEIYDYRLAGGFPREMIDPVRNNMIIHNTARQVLFGAAYAGYLYMLGDAMTNYPSDNHRVQTATFFSTFCPGAGQIYNKSYWRVPWALGGFAAFLYVVDWNNRVYQRYNTAFLLNSDNDPSTNPDFYQNTSVSELITMKNNARRNRDLAYILTGVWYLFNIMDAHVDAQLKDFDISDDLAWRLEPSVEYFYTPSTGNVSVLGMSLSYNF